MNRLGPHTTLGMEMKRLLVLAGVLASLALAACGGDDEDESAASAGESAAGESDSAASGQPAAGDKPSGGAGEEADRAAAGTEIVTADSQYGSVLFDADRRAIYYFDKETSETSECYGSCAEAWPPVLTDGDPQAGEGIAAKLLGTTEREDGSTQVTYADRPLYYYVDDPRGQVLCHNVEEFGGLWLAVEPSGEAVQ
jgi:predicted lipoprotein with Yx(FWY)xxD motif